MLAWLIWKIFVRGTSAAGCLDGLSHWRNFTITAGIRAKTLARHIERKLCLTALALAALHLHSRLSSPIDLDGNSSRGRTAAGNSDRDMRPV